jgi:flagellar motor protein MotB
MRAIAIAVLSVALTFAIVSGVVLYQKHGEVKNALLISEEKVAGLEGRLSQLDREISALRNRLRESVQRLERLKGTQSRISDLEQAITEKDQIHSQFEGAITTLKKDLEKERKANERLTAELAAKEASLTGLKGQLYGAQSRIGHLEGEVAETHKEVRRLRGRLSTLTQEKALAETEVDQLKSTYESLISGLNQQIENQEVTIERFEEKISVTFVDRILFEFGKATISAEGEDILQKVGETLRGIEDRKIRVVGHTDSRPILSEYQYKFPSNWELSAARASAVVRHFQNEIGLDPRSLEAVGRSFYDPVASNDTPEKRAKNRRVEIIVAPRLE